MVALQWTWGMVVIMKMIVYGFQGSCEDLQRLLKGGIYVENIKANNKGFTVDFSERGKLVRRPARYSEEELQKMYKAHMDGMSFSKIGDMFGCSKAYAHRVVKEICQRKYQK